MKFSKLKAIHSAQFIAEILPPRGVGTLTLNDFKRRKEMGKEQMYIEAHVSCIIACACVEHIYFLRTRESLECMEVFLFKFVWNRNVIAS